MWVSVFSLFFAYYTIKVSFLPIFMDFGLYFWCAVRSCYFLKVALFSLLYSLFCLFYCFFVNFIYPCLFCGPASVFAVSVLLFVLFFWMFWKDWTWFSWDLVNLRTCLFVCLFVYLFFVWVIVGYPQKDFLKVSQRPDLI